ncbi:hypothetical protein BC936DRAFT_137365 [Jimgerdemannia flammicorona]|uniref:Uncharacterized protein n=1 Tax=Jimgerdemannia flammicorona TaxID=994334 RepID=A0A433CXI1_9FUNG|nr:hypothetical protein BC936DRAFT_137365 [Jimgerdemannia flammicorona]
MSSPLFTMKNGPYHTGSKAHSKCRICFEIVRMRDITVLSVRYIKKSTGTNTMAKWEESPFGMGSVSTLNSISSLPYMMKSG